MAGIYIHIPFCQSRCKYCDFFSTTQMEKRHEYAETIIAEWNAWKRINHQWDHPETLYIGGGTPSVLEIDDIKHIVSTLHPTLTPGAEITMEANPGDLSLEKLQLLHSIGINRLSIGIQSFHDELLNRIGRRHTANEAIQAVKNAQQAGFTNISIDLIYGLPSETMDIWKEDVHKAISLGVSHISCYCLSYEENTPLTQMLRRGEIQELNENTLNDMYDYLVCELRANGYVQYEVSNFALDKKASIHNSNYWNFTPYLGLGAGAHSYDGKKRWWNPNDLATYINGIRDLNIEREEEYLTLEQKHIEQIMLGLRTSKGIPMDIVDNSIAEEYVNRGLLYKKDNNYVATLSGIHILNQIINNLV